jgi:hypothetical protein
MNTSVRRLAVGTAVAAFAWGGLAQAPVQSSTIEERFVALEAALARLEAGVATLDTRLALATTRVGDNAGQT